MISYGQLFILFLLVLLLFGDIRKIFNKFILFFVNLKSIYQKSNKTEDEDKKNK
jgi:hypothetical protein